MRNGASGAATDVAEVEIPFDPTKIGPFKEVDISESVYGGDLESWKWD